MGNVIIFDHPLIQHKISIMRSVDTSCKEFRELVKEVTMFMCYESLRDMPLKEVDVTTPLTTCKTKVLAGPEMAVVPILRAGLGMVEGVLELVPTAKVGHIGLYRDPNTLKPVEYYCKLPEDITEREVIVLDPMLATGGSSSAAIQFLKDRGIKNIKFVCLISAPEGIERLQNDHPDVPVFCAAKDERLNDHAYIIPGLGDAGDRLFGTN